MRHFKLPLIVTGIVFVVALVVGVVGVTLIHKAKLSNRAKAERAQKLGGATGVACLLILAPFWLIACGKVGKERKARLAAQAEQDSAT